MRSSDRTGVQGDAATPQFDARDEAQLARQEHDRVIDLLIKTVDLLHHVQESGDRVNMPEFRKATGKMLRRSSARHSLALAALALDGSPEYADELVRHAEEIGPNDVVVDR